MAGRRSIKDDDISKEISHTHPIPNNEYENDESSESIKEQCNKADGNPGTGMSENGNTASGYSETRASFRSSAGNQSCELAPKQNSGQSKDSLFDSSASVGRDRTLIAQRIFASEASSALVSEHKKAPPSSVRKSSKAASVDNGPKQKVITGRAEPVIATKRKAPRRVNVTTTYVSHVTSCPEHKVTSPVNASANSEQKSKSIPDVLIDSAAEHAVASSAVVSADLAPEHDVTFSHGRSVQIQKPVETCRSVAEPEVISGKCDMASSTLSAYLHHEETFSPKINPKDVEPCLAEREVASSDEASADLAPEHEVTFSHGRSVQIQNHVEPCPAEREVASSDEASADLAPEHEVTFSHGRSVQIDPNHVEPCPADVNSTNVQYNLLQPCPSCGNLQVVRPHSPAQATVITRHSPSGSRHTPRGSTTSMISAAWFSMPAEANRSHSSPRSAASSMTTASGSRSEDGSTMELHLHGANVQVVEDGRSPVPVTTVDLAARQVDQTDFGGGEGGTLAPEGDAECYQCHRRPATRGISGCDHVVLCYVCVRRARECPVCRRPMVSFYRAYR